MILCTGNARAHTHTMTGANTWIQQSCKLSTQNPTKFLYTVNEQPEKEIKKTIPFIIASKIIEYLGRNLTKKVIEIYSESYKTLVKHIKEDLNKWKNILCSCSRRQYCSDSYYWDLEWTCKLAIIYKFIANLIKIPIVFPYEVEKPILKFILNCKGPI